MHNGIFITEKFAQSRSGHLMFGDPSSLFTLRAPQISVFDNEGRLLVNLQRNEIHGLPFESALRQKIIKDVIAYILVSGQDIDGQASLKDYPLIIERGNGIPVSWLLYSPKGMILADSWLIASLGYGCILSSTTDSASLRQQLETFASPNTLFAYPRIKGSQSRYKTWLEQSLELLKPFPHQKEEAPVFTGARIVISLTRYKEFQTFGKYRKELRQQYINLEDTNGWVFLEAGLPPVKSFDFSRVTSKSPGEPDVAFAGLHFNTNEWAAKEASEVGRVWREVIGDAGIPFDMSQRQHLLAHSFEKLNEYIQKYLRAAEEKKAL